MRGDNDERQALILHSCTDSPTSLRLAFNVFSCQNTNCHGSYCALSNRLDWMEEQTQHVQVDGVTYEVPQLQPPIPPPLLRASTLFPQPQCMDERCSSCVHPGPPSPVLPPPVQQHAVPGAGGTDTCVLNILLESLTRPSGYGLWAHFLALATALLCLLFGSFTLVWWLLSAPSLNSPLTDLVVSCFAFAIAVLVLYEEVDGLPLLPRVQMLNLGMSHYGVRAGLYVLLSIPLLLSWPTLLPAAGLLVTGAINFVAQSQREMFQQDVCSIGPVLHDSLATDLLLDTGYSVARSGFSILVHIRAMNKVRSFVWLVVYLAINAVVFALVWRYWSQQVDESRAMFDDGMVDEAHTLTQWLTAAKAFGWLIDLNAALLLLPVSRRLIRVLYHWSTYMGAGVLTRWIIQPVVRALPLDSHLTFHRLVGLVVVIASVGHTTAHFVEFALRPDLSQQLVGGLWPFVSGVVLCFVLLLICTGALRRVQRANWSIFLRTHSLYVLLLALLLTHGKGGLGPNFWKFLLLPAAVFVVDKMLQLIYTQGDVLLFSMRTEGNVIVLEFDRVGALAGRHHVGDYYLLQCPTLSRHWHAFTISSAPSDKTVSMHIQVHGPGSFTAQLRDWLTMCSEKAAGVESSRLFLHRDDRTGDMVPGRRTGPDHRALLRLDGPYATPSRNFDSASVVHMVAGGIGITPALSAIQEIVFHQWSVPARHSPVQHCYLTLALPYAELGSFHWLLHTLNAIQQHVTSMKSTGREEMKDRSLRFHIYVTSVPTHVNRDHADFALFTDLQLAVHLQRPSWPDIVKEHHLAHPDESIAVLVCAREELVQSLTKQCDHMNQQRVKCFMVHPELF